MVKVNINLGDRSYPIHIASDYKGFAKCLKGAKLTGKFVLITDTNVDKFQTAAFIEELELAGISPYKFVVPAGEINKNLDTVKTIYKFLLDLKLDRHSTLIALGGGVVGDITGFVAATFLRGINFVQVPTTTLAQADSSVGGKVGVDFEGAKNVIGAFYQPQFVYMNVNTLKTLPKRDMTSGLAEVLKHGIIDDAEFFEFIDYNVKKIFDFDDDILQYMAKVNCSIKGHIVEKDEKESGLRKNLNFGHTIGHAIESVSNFDLMHGECISIGMVGAFKMARRMEMIGEVEVSKITRTLEKIGLPVRLRGLNVEKVYKQMFYDKKIENNKLLFILPKKIGEVVQLNIEDESLIKSVLEGLG